MGPLPGYLVVVVVALMMEDVTSMLRECPAGGELCAALGVSGVAGRGSTVPDSASSSSVSVLCRPSLGPLVLVLVLALVPSTCSLVFWCFFGSSDDPSLEFGRRL